MSHLAIRFAAAVLVAGIVGGTFADSVPESVKASSFGWNQTNATCCLQAALDSGARRVIVDRRESEWLIETVRVPSDMELVFADGVVVRAVPGAMVSPNDCLIRCNGVSNVVIRGEGGAVVRMNRSDYLDRSRYRHSEHRHLLSIVKSKGVAVRDLILEESGGDGVYLLLVRDVLLENLVCRGHARQGTSLIDGGDVVIRNCIFSETKGALPECGMDIEPARSTFSVGKVTVDGCLFCSNNCSGLAINVSHLKRSCGKMDVTYRNCKMFDNSQRGIWTIFSNGSAEGPVGGRVHFEGCEVRNNGSGPLQIANLESEAVCVSFTNCIFDAAGMRGRGSPIILSNGGVKSDLNNLSFGGCRLVNAPRRAPVSFSAMTGGGVLPGGARGVLDIAYADGGQGGFDFGTLEAKYKPRPELREFETGTIDISSLVPANPGGIAGEQRVAGYRRRFTFLQHVGAPGEYPIRFQSGTVGKTHGIDVEVEVFDQAGTPHDVFSVKDADFTYMLKSTARNAIYRFVVTPRGSRVKMSSTTPGHGFVATDRIHWLTGRGENLYFQALPGAGDVKVELTMSHGEWVSAELIAPDGSVADSCEKADAGVILVGRRAKDAPSQVWKLHVTRFVDDCALRLGAATSGVYAYDPEMILVVREGKGIQ